MIHYHRGFSYRPTFAILLTSLAVVWGLAPSAQSAPILSRDINTYALFAYNELVWKGGNVATDTGHIYGGNIGVNYPGMVPGGFSLNFGTSARGIMSPGSQAAADSVRADDAQDIIYTLFANSLNPSFGATVLDPNPATPKGNYPFSTPIIATANLPVLPFTPGRALTNNAADLTVGGAGGQPSPYTIGPGAYRDVRFNDNVVVTFQAGEYDMRNVSIGKNVTINLSDATLMAIDKQFDPNDNLTMGTNPGYHGMSRLYVGGLGDNPSTTPSTNFSHNAVIHTQYFAPNSWLDVGGNNELYGRFWALRITGDPNNNVHYVAPEPTSMVMLMMGMTGLIAIGRKSSRRFAVAR